MIINRIYENQNILFAVACFLPARAKDLSVPLYRAGVCLHHPLRCVNHPVLRDIQRARRSFSLTELTSFSLQWKYSLFYLQWERILLLFR